MGDMADWVNEQMLDPDFGELDFTDYSEPKRKPVGPGKCPVCRGPTHFVKDNEFGPFYGCNKYPKCKGSRNYVAKKKGKKT
jgi:ssDNA-binding Zn-finger/Zn-ribbon topoisomerase 1